MKIRIISFVVSLALSTAVIFNTSINVIANSAEIVEEKNGVEKIDTIVEDIMISDNIGRKQEDKLYKDITAISNAGLPLDNIAANDNGGKLEYTVLFEDGIKNCVTLEYTGEAEVKYHFKENDIENEVVFCENGDVYLDGNMVLCDTVTKETVPGNFETSVEGVSYSKKAPKQIKSWRSYSLNWLCPSIYFQKALKALTESAFISIVERKAGKKFSVFATILFSQAKENDPYSTGVSFKIWAANSKNPATSRYTKLKKILYTKINYKGKASSPVIYYATKG